MNDLDKMKKIAELKKIEAAIAELEYKMEERRQDIQRMQEHIDIQINRKTQLEGEILNE